MKIKTVRPVIFLCTTLLMVSLACSVDLYGTPTPAPATELPVLPEELTATLLSEQIVSGDQQFFTDEFDVENPAWKYTVVNGAEHQIVNGIVGLMSVRTVGGLLIFDLQGKGAWVYATYEPFTYTDVRLDVKVGNRGSNNNNVSLFCRKSDAGWYEVDIANNGMYEVLFGKIVGDAVEYTLITDGGSVEINAGMTENEYGILCQGNTLTLFINGKEVRSLVDNKYLLPEGKVGISVSSFRDVPVIVDFFWAKISQP